MALTSDFAEVHGTCVVLQTKIVAEAVHVQAFVLPNAASAPSSRQLILAAAVKTERVNVTAACAQLAPSS